MNIFRESTLGDEGDIQAARLDESLEVVFSGGKADIDSREDPEISDLMEIGSLIHISAEEATSRPSFQSFRARSRAAILHAVGDMHEEQDRSHTFVNILKTFIPNRGSVIPAVSASAATLALFIFINSDSTSSQAVATESSFQEQVVQSVSSVSSDDSEMTNTINMTTNVTMDLPEMAISDQEIVSAGSNTVSAINQKPYGEFDRLQFSRRAAESVAVVTRDIERTLDTNGSVTEEQLYNLTAGLAALGNGIRMDPPGAQYSADLNTYQDIIAQAFVLIHSLSQQTDPMTSNRDYTPMSGAITAAKVVAEDSMLIATRYVNSNNILHYE
jgi:hypothetical protein